MGFILEKYNNNRAALIVAFRGDQPQDNYTPSNSVETAMEYFNLYLDDENNLMRRTDETVALDELGVAVQDAAEVRDLLNNIITGFDDETAVTNAVLFPIWVGNGKTYLAGQRIRYNDTLYRVLQTHTSQPDWTPEVAPSLFARVLNPDPQVIPEWEQPDATNAYMIGDRVRYQGAIYESTIDNNVWAPDAYPAGWQLIEEES